MAYVHIEYALYSIILLMFSMNITMNITDASVDFSSLWKRCLIFPKTVAPKGIKKEKPTIKRIFLIIGIYYYVNLVSLFLQQTKK